MTFDQSNAWRVERIRVLEEELQRHWTLAVLDAAGDGYPAAHGLHHLQDARSTILRQIDAFSEQNSPRIQHETATPLDDPLHALADLDRAVTESATKPTLRLAEPRRTPAVDVHARHHAFIQGGPDQAPAAAAGSSTWRAGSAHRRRGSPSGQTPRMTSTGQVLINDDHRLAPTGLVVAELITAEKRIRGKVSIERSLEPIGQVAPGDTTEEFPAFRRKQRVSRPATYDVSPRAGPHRWLLAPVARWQ